MRALLIAAVVATATACTDVAEPAAPPDYCVDVAEADIAALFGQWGEALRSGSPAQVDALYASDAVLLPTLSDVPRSSSTTRRDYFRHFMARQPQGRIDQRRIVIGCNYAVDTGLYTFVFLAGEQVAARYTFTYAYDGARWRITSHHSSRMPNPDQASGKE